MIVCATCDLARPSIFKYCPNATFRARSGFLEEVHGDSHKRAGKLIASYRAGEAEEALEVE